MGAGLPVREALLQERVLFRKHGALLTSRQVEQLIAADGDSEWAN
jgi:hypothetical protein